MLLIFLRIDGDRMLHNMWIQVISWSGGLLFMGIVWVVWTVCERIVARVRNFTHTQEKQ